MGTEVVLFFERQKDCLKAVSPKELTDKLHALQDAGYQKFHAKLLPGIDNVIGVRVPMLRAIAKDICADNTSAIKILNSTAGTHEYAMVQSFIAAGMKCPIDVRVQMVDRFVPQIYSWAICDCFVNSVKDAKKYPEPFMPLIQKYIGSPNEYEERFSAVMLLTHYVTEDYINDTLELLAQIKGEEYYTKMAVAWAYSMCLVKFPDLSLEFLKGAELDEWTLKKAIQKTRESYRCKPELKEQMKELI